MKAKEYIDRLVSRGTNSFTINKMCEDTKTSKSVAGKAILRLRKKNEIVNVIKGYYLILTPQFRNWGCLPADHFIDGLMKHWNQNYYVGLLTAAMYYGAAHQKPQVFQVITDKYRHNIHCGRIRIQFITRKNMPIEFVLKRNTVAGYINISKPELTMIDLCRFMKQSGGISHIATVLDELVEVIKPSVLKSVLETNNEIAIAQRLGYILEVLEYHKLAEVVYQYLQKHKTYMVPLTPYDSIKEDSEKSKKWKVIVNSVVESDLRDSY